MTQSCPSCRGETPGDARFCPNCGSSLQVSDRDEQRRARLAEAAPAPLVDKMLASEPVGERRIITALFADVVGSTRLMEDIDPEDWTVYVNQAFELMGRAVYRYEGTIAQLQGDAMLAFFGAPVAHEDDPERAVRAALEMTSRIGEFGRQLQSREGPGFDIRVGINTGPVVVGNVGSNLRYEYTALGDAINVAARMQAAARSGTVLLAEATYRPVAPTFEVNDLGPISLKGKREPVHAYEVVDLKDTPGPKRGLGIASPIVGRDRELDQLVQLMSIVRAGSGRPVCIIGEPGIGKTRLVSEFRLAAVSSGPVNWIQGRCLSFGVNLAYHLVVDLVRSAVGATASTGDEQVKEKVSAALHSVPSDAAADTGLYLAHLLSLPLSAEESRKIARLDSENLLVRYIGAVKMLFKTAADQAPLVLLCEDVHWADSASVQILVELMALLSPMRILLCLTSRTEHQAPGWSLISSARDLFGEMLSEIHLDPLSAEQGAELVGHLLEIESLPPRVRADILSRAEGNPFFLEEIIRMMMDEGAIERIDDRWVATERVEHIEVPGTLQGLLLARIDRLPQRARQSLRVASVIGRQFPARVLERVLSEGTGL